jgi:hypothetical protein
MKQYMQRVWKDIRQGQNIDVYLTTLVCASLLVLDIFNLVSDPSALSSGILATLLLVALSTLNSRHTDQRLNQALDKFQRGQGSAEFFGQWDNNAVKPRIKSAQEISVLATSNFEFINENSDQLKALVERGGLLRCILVDPDGNAIKMATDRLYGDKQRPEYLVSQINLSLQKLREIAASAAKPECVQVAVVDYLPASVITVVNPQSSDGVMFVTLNGFGHSPWTRPTFVMQREKDAKWFLFYNKNIENLWAWPKLKRINLSEGIVP